MNASQAQHLITSYNSQLSGRFYSNSMALEVLVCLILILLLVVEVIKLVKKAYEWQT
jgi:ABC-type multidrug transport system permease subunit